MRPGLLSVVMLFLAACEGQLSTLGSDGAVAPFDAAGTDGAAPTPDASVPVVCGDGIVGRGETCDPVASCPAICDDGAACTTDVQSGDSSTCNVACEVTVIETCADADGCCPDGCDSTSDSDCSESCGDGRVDTGETCDPPGSCPTDCNDGTACTTDRLTGSAAACSAACSNVAITACASGDGCCPPACDATNDGDCMPACGNGAVEAGETCDPPSSCPASCDDGMTCTADTASGSAAACTRACAHAAITACTPGDGCCPSGCSSAMDSDCSISCGNGVVEMGETCDPPSSCPASCNDGIACTADVRTGAASSCNVRCTNMPITSCSAGDGCCPSSCTVATDADCIPVCGDTECTSGETCTSCATDCGSCACGDGTCTVSAGEMCTACGADCDNRTAGVCGNGECQSGETSASCQADCGPMPWSSSWAIWENEVVTLFNMHRAAGTDCPSGPKGVAGMVTMESALQTASRLHSWDQSYSGYFSHTSCNGRTFTQRASAQGTSAFGEIIASGQTSPASAVAAWMASTSGHCDIIMNGSYSGVGVGYAQASGGGRIWTGMWR